MAWGKKVKVVVVPGKPVKEIKESELNKYNKQIKDAKAELLSAQERLNKIDLEIEERFNSHRLGLEKQKEINEVYRLKIQKAEIEQAKDRKSLEEIKSNTFNDIDLKTKDLN